MGFKDPGAEKPTQVTKKEKKIFQAALTKRFFAL